MTNELGAAEPVGQVSNDLHESVRDERDPNAEEAWHALSHLVGLLRALELAARP